MSGMKFRRTCSVCNATFFSPDRKAAFCQKCIKKKVVKHVPAEVSVQPQPVRVAPRPIPRPVPVVPAGLRNKKKPPRPPKSGELNTDVRQRIIGVYQEEYGGQQPSTREIHNQIANKLWIKRQVVADVLREVSKVQASITEEQKKRAIEMYKRFVESGHRPEGGRRRAISAAINVPYKQVMKVIREWSLAEYAKSSTPNPSRQQLFEIEKMYWNELKGQRYGLMELPARIAEALGFVTRWQVLRWLDVLHDDERAFDKVPEPPQEIQEKVLDAYQEYLKADSPPEEGLHYTIAGLFEKISPRQVHKILQSYRHKMRTEYPHL